MPAVFQRLSDAIRVIMLRNTPVEGLLGMLDDFLGIIYRQPGESDHALLDRGRMAAKAFDEELKRIGIGKQSKKDSPTAWITVWLGFEINTKECWRFPRRKRRQPYYRYKMTYLMTLGG